VLNSVLNLNRGKSSFEKAHLSRFDDKAKLAMIGLDQMSAFGKLLKN